jgi:hypothetical protein
MTVVLLPTSLSRFYISETVVLILSYKFSERHLMNKAVK